MCKCLKAKFKRLGTGTHKIAGVLNSKPVTVIPITCKTNKVRWIWDKKERILVVNKTIFEKIKAKIHSTLLLLTFCMLSLSTTSISHAGLFGGGLSGPMPVYNIDKTVDAATLATQINTAQQLAADLANLKNMDSATAAANMQQIQSSLQQLITLQNQMSGMIMDYENFQYAWDEQYGDFSDYNNMTSADYAENARRLRESMDQSLHNAMLSQGFVAQNANSAAALQQLLRASQTAEGALAAAQVGNQIAALQAQQMIQFQQMVAQSNRAQNQWLEYQIRKEEMERAAAEKFFREPPTPKKGQGSSF